MDLHERGERRQHERKVVDGAKAHSISGAAIGPAFASPGNLLTRVETAAEEGHEAPMAPRGFAIIQINARSMYGVPCVFRSHLHHHQYLLKNERLPQFQVRCRPGLKLIMPHRHNFHQPTTIFLAELDWAWTTTPHTYIRKSEDNTERTHMNMRRQVDRACETLTKAATVVGTTPPTVTPKRSHHWTALTMTRKLYGDPRDDCAGPLIALPHSGPTTRTIFEEPVQHMAWCDTAGHSFAQRALR